MACYERNCIAMPLLCFPGTTSPDHTVKYVSIATVSGILVGLLLVLGFLKCMFLYIRRSRRPYPVPSGLYFGFQGHSIRAYVGYCVSNRYSPVLDRAYSVTRTRLYLIGWVFCDIQNNRGRGKGYQPKPKAEADNPFRDLDYSEYHENRI